MTDLSQLCMGCMNDRGGAAVCQVCGFREGKPKQVAMQLPLRTILNDQYLIGRALGAGGFAITYLAWDTRLARRVAIKEYMPTSLASRDRDRSLVVPHEGVSGDDFGFGLERFLEEARLVAQFQNHPGIISVVNYFPANGTAYLVMEYLEGQTLLEYMQERGGRIEFQKALALMTPVMDALRELHRANVLHRDISPDNIYITTTGQVKLLDFGAARQALRDRNQGLSVVLKVAYAPEEQFRTMGNQGPWTDVYAVGATLYHLITGQTPPTSIDRLADDRIVPPRQLGVDMTQDQESALMTALSVTQSRRYPTVQDFQAAIGLPFSSGQDSSAGAAAGRTDPQGLVRFWSKVPLWGKVAAGGGVILLLLAFFLFRPTPGPTPRPIQGPQNPSQPASPSTQQRAAEPCAAVVGRWRWFTGGIVTIRSNGTLNYDGSSAPQLVFRGSNSGSWNCTDARSEEVTIRWLRGGMVNSLILSNEGQRLSSTDQTQWYVSATRVAR